MTTVAVWLLCIIAAGLIVWLAGYLLLFLSTLMQFLDAKSALFLISMFSLVLLLAILIKRALF